MTFPPWNVVLLETEHFAALPTRGAIVPGWMLIVTKEHRLCMGRVSLQLHAELIAFVEKVRSIVEYQFGPVVVFEHGPAEPGQQVGCGVDHAHIHVVPTRCELLAELPSVFPEPVQWQQVESLAKTMRYAALKRDYLFVEQPKGHCWIGTHVGLGSQLFRKVIAKSVGRPDEFDWKVFPEVAHVNQTVKAFRESLAPRTQPILA